MGIFNQHSNNQPQQQRFLRGIQGSPGVGFCLTKDGNYDVIHKKLKNVGEGVESSDAITKHQLETAINSKLNTSPSSNIFVTKDSPEVAADLDMKGNAIKNLKVTPGGDSSATSRKYVDRKLDTKANKNELNAYLKLDGSNQISGNLKMNSKRITGLTEVPAYDGEATNKKYVDVKLNDKANKNDLNGYLKLDGTSQMQGNLEMNNNRITRLPLPNLGDEAATKTYVTITMNHLPNLFLDRQGNSKMLGNLQMNDHRITGLTNPPNNDDEATNKKYVDTRISKSNIKPSHTSKNVFQYLTDDVNEWSTEYNVKVLSISELAESPHSWDKKVLNLSPLKKDGNYRFRVGLQMFRMTTNKEYSLVVELYNRDYTTWERQQTYVEGMGMWIKGYNTTKYQYHYGSSNTLYYTKTLIKFRKTSGSPPVFVYFTVHYDDKSGDLNTYPDEFKDQVYMVAYGVEGLTDHVDPEVYDAHEAFEIDKTKMKMLVPLDMNGKKIMNTNFDLKFKDLFKIIKCYFKVGQQGIRTLIHCKINNQVVSFTSPVVLHSISLHKTGFNNEKIRILGISNAEDIFINLNRNLSYTHMNMTHFTIMFIIDSGIRFIELRRYKGNDFDVDLALAFN